MPRIPRLPRRSTGAGGWGMQVGRDRTTVRLDAPGSPAGEPITLPIGWRSVVRGDTPVAERIVRMHLAVDRALAPHAISATSVNPSLTPCGELARAVPSSGESPWTRFRAVDSRKSIAPRRRQRELRRLGALLIADAIAGRLCVAHARVGLDAPRHRRSGPRLAGAAVTILIAALGVATTSATLTDQVAMGAVSAAGGTLDIKVFNGTADQDGPNATWGTFNASVSLMKPGDVRYADITLRNPGSLAATVQVTATGSDTHPDFASHCFSMYFRELVAGSSVQSVGDGTMFGVDETETGTRGLHPATGSTTGPAQLYTNGATRTATSWAAGSSHIYRLSVRMRDGCQQGSNGTAGALGTVSYTFDAVQA